MSPTSYDWLPQTRNDSSEAASLSSMGPLGAYLPEASGVFRQCELASSWEDDTTIDSRLMHGDRAAGEWAVENGGMPPGHNGHFYGGDSGNGDGI